MEVRHRLRVRAEDRIRGLKDTGMNNLPLQAFATRSGSRSPNSPTNYSPEPNCSPGPDNPPGSGNPNDSGYDCRRTIQPASGKSNRCADGVTYSEAAAVRIEDYQETLRGHRVLHLVGKGAKPATMPLTVPVLRVLEACR
jgi:hypothetical protein